VLFEIFTSMIITSSNFLLSLDRSLTKTPLQNVQCSLKSLPEPTLCMSKSSKSGSAYYRLRQIITFDRLAVKKMIS
jgi:hypothetical protein